MLSGYKTYILATAAVLYGVTGLILGHFDANTAMSMIWPGLTAGALRSAISNQQ